MTIFLFLLFDIISIWHKLNFLSNNIKHKFDKSEFQILAYLRVDKLISISIVDY